MKFSTALFFLGVMLVEHSVTVAAELVVDKLIGTASEIGTNEPRPLGAGDRMAKASGIQTGEESKIQLSGPRGTVRFGSKSYMPTTNPKEIGIGEGLVVIGSKPGRFRRSMKAQTPEHEIKVTGTVQSEYVPNAYLMVTCVEGYADIHVRSFFGDMIRINAGETLLLSPTDKRLPDPVAIDLQRLYETSGLLEGPLGPMPTVGAILKAISKQQDELQKGELVTTPLRFPRGGTSIEIQDGRSHVRDLEDPVVKVGTDLDVSLSRSSEDASESIPKVRVVVEQGEELRDFGDLAVTTSGINLSSFLKPGAARLRLSSEDVDAKVRLVIDVGRAVQTGEPILREFAFDLSGGRVVSLDLSASGEPGRSGEVSVSSPDILQIANASVTGRNIALTHDGPGAVDGFLLTDSQIEVTNSATITSDLSDVNLLGSGPNSLRVAAQTVDIRSNARGVLLENAEVAGVSGVSISALGQEASSSFVRIDSSTVTAESGNVAVESSHYDIQVRNSNVGLVVRNSSDVKALAEHIQLLTDGQSVALSDSHFQALQEILIDRPSDLALTNVNMKADSIRARIFGSAGSDAQLIVDNSVLSAATLLQLYAEGVSTLEFRGAVDLRAPQIDLAGNVVRVQDGGVVTIDGRGRVFANAHEYNVEGLGVIVQPQGQVEQLPFPLRPSFKP